MDRLAWGSAWLQATQRKHAASPVSYQRGDSSIAVAAQAGRSNFTTQDGSGFYVDTEARDFLVTAADLVLDDIPVEPAAGDLIVVTGPDRCTQYVYEVMPPPGEPAWRWADDYHVRYRIHVKYTGTTPTSPR